MGDAYKEYGPKLRRYDTVKSYNSKNNVMRQIKNNPKLEAIT